MDAKEFKVDLAQLHRAIGTVRNESGSIEQSMAQIAKGLPGIQQYWATPATSTFLAYQQWFVKVQTELHALLDETARRMQAAYDNYHAAEEANFKNLHSSHSPSGGGSGSGHHTDASPHHGAKSHGGNAPNHGSGADPDRALRIAREAVGSPSQGKPALLGFAPDDGS